MHRQTTEKLYREPILKIVTYNASAVKNYNSTSSLERFENKHRFPTLKKNVQGLRFTTPAL
jgi:hypothetical protein